MRTAWKLIAVSVLPICFASALVAADAPTTAPGVGPTTMPTTEPVAISWDQAKDHIGQSVTVTGPVVGTHDFDDAVVLNVGKDFPDPDRFTVYVKMDMSSDATKPAFLTTGTTISVTGTVKIYRKVPEIESDPTKISVIGQATTEPAMQQ
jgi:hypothetical protein